MSYDIRFEIDAGGPEPFCIGDDKNYTSNVSGMWLMALGYSLSDMHGKACDVVIPDLERAVAHMEDPEHKEDYQRMNPSNGWGNYEGAIGVLRWMLDECRAHPKAQIYISC